MCDSCLPLCNFCKHFHKNDPRQIEPFTCDAFPAAIPENIYFESGDHRQPVEGDHGIQFEKKPDLADDQESYFHRHYETSR